MFDENIPREYVFHSRLGYYSTMYVISLDNRDSFSNGGATDNRISFANRFVGNQLPVTPVYTNRISLPVGSPVFIFRFEL